MAVWPDGQIFGTIGGGIMEHKLVELALSKMQTGELDNFIKQQNHSKSESERSGMICSGKQTVGFCFLRDENSPEIEAIIEAFSSDKEQSILFSDQDALLLETSVNKNGLLKSKSSWEYREGIQSSPRIHIFGGGHVGLALSQMMAQLDYEVCTYDDRDGLNTMKQNVWAHQKRVISFDDVREAIDFRPSDSVAIVTFGYRSDKLILKQIYQLPFAFIGMMGSDSKLETLWQELEEEGITKDDLAHLKAPIGLPIYSKTTMEIAVSIAAEIIHSKNKDLPTGRSPRNPRMC